MRKVLLGLTGIALLAAAGYFGSTEYNKKSYQPKDYLGTMVNLGLADGMSEHYIMLRANSKTGRIEHEDVMKSRASVKKYFAANSKNTVNSLIWEYRGPDFVGGRTRTILQDNQTDNSSIYYTAGVAGGVFISWNGGSQWYDISGDIGSYAVADMAQTSDGKVFAVTGVHHDVRNSYFQGHNTESGTAGEGLFRKDGTDENPTWTLIDGTAPSPNSGAGSAWRTTSTMVADPTEDGKLFVGTNAGLKLITDAHTDNPVITDIGLNVIIEDVVISPDGGTVYTANGSAVTQFKDNGGTNVEQVKQVNVPILGQGRSIDRMSLAVSPVDSFSNYIYAACADFRNGPNCLYGIFQSKDQGDNWTLIGPPGSSFDPYSNPGVNCQGDYDNAIAVSAADPGKIFVGGVQLWSWQESANNPGTGGWTKVATGNGGGLLDTNYVHPDVHRILIPNEDEVYVATDGGIAKSIDGGQTWGHINNGFNVTQFYHMDAAAGVEFEVDGQTYVVEQIAGGTQDNGTQLVGINFNNPTSAQQVRGGDGFSTAFSNLSNQVFATSYLGLSPTRHSLDNPLGEPLYDSELNNQCGNIFGGNPCGPFFCRMRYFETYKAEKTYDSVKVFLKKDVVLGDTFVYTSAIGNDLPIIGEADGSYNDGDSLMMPDWVQSRMVMVFNGNRIYATKDAAKFSKGSFDWDLIVGSQSYPDPPPAGGFASNIFAMQFSKDGGRLYFGTENGRIFRVDNLNEAYDSATTDIRSIRSVITCTEIGPNSISGRIISDIAVDPNDDNHIVVTAGGYGESNYIWECDSATILDPSSEWRIIDGSEVTGGLPDMPVFSVVIADHNRNEIIVGTEYGIWGTQDASASPAQWTYAGNGMPPVPTYTVMQQTNEYVFDETYPETKNTHYRKLYAGTHGRGFYVSADLVGIDEGEDGTLASAGQEEQLQMKMFPNPVRSEGFVELNLATSENILLEVFDLNGKRLQVIHNGSMKEGNNRIEFNVSNMNNGTYLMVAKGQEDLKVSKFIVLK